jgi:hypothetical protein
MALISVGCKLPQGLIMELGYEIVPGGVNKLPEYKRVVLAGANQHSVVTGSLRSPSPKDLRPGITNNVDEAFFDAWVEAHKATNIVRNGLVFKAKNAGEATAKAADIAQKPTGMEALDPTKQSSVKKFDPDDQGNIPAIK